MLRYNASGTPAAMNGERQTGVSPRDRTFAPFPKQKPEQRVLKTVKQNTVQ